MYRIIVRIETNKNFIECDTPTLILLDEPANFGKVVYCAATGHGEGNYHEILKHTRPATEEEAIKAVNLYGYNTIKDFKIVKRRV